MINLPEILSFIVVMSSLVHYFLFLLACNSIFHPLAIVLFCSFFLLLLLYLASLNVIITSNRSSIFPKWRAINIHLYIVLYVSIYPQCVLQIYTTRRREAVIYLYFFFRPPVVMAMCITRFGMYWYTYSAGKAGKKKNYFGTSEYSQEDIATAVLFTDNLSRGDTHIRILLSSKPLF